MIRLGEAAHCEHQGAYGYETGHKIGRQLEDELRFIDYYNLPWAFVYRSTDSNVAAAMAIRMRQAVQNTNIGYGQPTRLTGVKLLLADPDPSHISQACDFDCSSLVNSIVKVSWMQIGHNIPIAGTEVTAQMPIVYSAADMKPFFLDITSLIRLEDGDGLMPGDILVTPRKHTAMVVEVEEDTERTGKVATTLCLRKKPLTGTVIAYMQKGATVTILEEVTASNGATWYRVNYAGKEGYCSARYIL